MNSYVLTQKGKVKLYKRRKYKKSRTYGFLIEQKSNLIGRYYKFIFPASMNKINKINSCALSYSFLDGSAVDEDEFNSNSVKHKYKYDNVYDLIRKLDEMYITENVLNDTFWVFDTYWIYMFHNIKMKIFTNKYMYKFKKSSELFKFLKIDTSKKIVDNPIESVLEITKNNKWILHYDIKSARKKISKSSRFFINIYSDIYIEVDYEFISKINSVYIKSNLYMCYDYDSTGLKKEKENSYDLEYKPKYYNFSKLFEAMLTPKVVSKLESNNGLFSYDIKPIVKYINNKKNKITLKKFFKRFIKI